MASAGAALHCEAAVGAYICVRGASEKLFAACGQARRKRSPDYLKNRSILAISWQGADPAIAHGATQVSDLLFKGALLCRL